MFFASQDEFRVYARKRGHTKSGERGDRTHHQENRAQRYRTAYQLLCELGQMARIFIWQRQPTSRVQFDNPGCEPVNASLSFWQGLGPVIRLE
jgi:hypothetical protein